jgi:hypothetical protein
MLLARQLARARARRVLTYLLCARARTHKQCAWLRRSLHTSTVLRASAASIVPHASSVAASVAASASVVPPPAARRSALSPKTRAVAPEHGCRSPRWGPLETRGWPAPPHNASARAAQRQRGASPARSVGTHRLGSANLGAASGAHNLGAARRQEVRRLGFAAGRGRQQVREGVALRWACMSEQARSMRGGCACAPATRGCSASPRSRAACV